MSATQSIVCVPERVIFAVVAVLTITVKSACVSHCEAAAEVSLTSFESTGEVKVLIPAIVSFQVVHTFQAKSVVRFVTDDCGIFVIVLLAQLIVLLVRVSVVDFHTRVSVAFGKSIVLDVQVELLRRVVITQVPLLARLKRILFVSSVA
jgi:hypothetical protein